LITGLGYKQTTKYYKHNENSKKSNKSKGYIETNHCHWKFKRAQDTAEQ